MGIFSILKRKSKHLSVVEYDKLVDSKIGRIREFIRLNLHASPDDKDFDKELAKTFELYVYNLRNELSKTANKEVFPIRFRKQEIVLSPISAYQAFNILYKRNRKKIVWYKGVFKFLRLVRIYVVLFFKDLILRYKLRKIKKLFSGYNLSNKTALNLMMAVDLNKRVEKRFKK